MFFSCTKEGPEQNGDNPDTPVVPEKPVDVTGLNVTLPAVEAFDLYWSEGDVVTASKGTDVNVSEALSSVEANAVKALFTFPSALADGDFVRFPQAPMPNVFTIPQQWTYTGGMFPKALYPMVGKVSIPEENKSETVDVQLSNVMAMFKFTLTGAAQVVNLELKSLAGEAIYGAYMLAEDGTLSGAGTEGAVSISFDSPFEITAQGREILIPIRPNTYAAGFTLKIADASGMSMNVKFLTGETEEKAIAKSDVLSATFEYKPGQDYTLGPLVAEVAKGEGQKPANALRIGQFNVWSDQDRLSKFTEVVVNEETGEEETTYDSKYQYRLWQYAGDAVASTAVAMDCDIICFNEISENLSKPEGLQAYMEKFSKEYTYSLNWPNKKNGAWFWETEESTYANGLAYKASVVRLEASGKFWLNEAGSTTDDENSGGYRTCVWAKFTQLATEKTFYVAVTHLSIESQGTSEESGAYAAGYWNLQTAKNLVANFTTNVGCTENDVVILLGDMNSNEETDNQGFLYLDGTLKDDSEAPQNTTLVFTDVRDYLKANDALAATEYGYIGTNNGTYNSAHHLRDADERLDHIMFRGACQVSNYRTYRNTFTVEEDPLKIQWFPSDHVPVSADFVLN